jgi:hypothetical protein
MAKMFWSLEKRLQNALNQGKRINWQNCSRFDTLPVGSDTSTSDTTVWFSRLVQLLQYTSEPPILESPECRVEYLYVARRRIVVTGNLVLYPELPGSIEQVQLPVHCTAPAQVVAGSTTTRCPAIKNRREV